MVIHQAVFGPLKGHSFLQGSCDSLAAIFRNAAWVTDLPQTAPSGVAWVGFLRLVRLDEQLLLIHTRPFESASRAGMVLSRAAFIPLAIVEQLHDLRSVARVLQAEWTEGDAVSPIDLGASSASVHVTEPTTLAVQIAVALSQSIKRPLVVIGQDGFDEAMLDLWARVPPEFRSHLTFGFSFSQEDVRDLSIVCTPNELSGRWDPALQVNTTEQGAVCSYSATLLNLPIDASVRSFANELQLSLDSPTAITIALKASQLWNDGTGTADAVNLLRILAERAGSGPSATAIKSEVVEQLTSSVTDWTVQDVLSMRNLELTDIPGSGKVWEALASCVGSLPSRVSPTDIGDIIQSWATQRATPLWLSVIGTGLGNTFANKGVADSLFSELWHAMAKLPERAVRLLSLLASAITPQKRLLESAPRTIEVPLADRLLSEFVSRGWWEAAGIILARSRPVRDALNVALNCDSKSSKKVLLASALSEASDQEVVAAALASQDVTAIQIAADTCIRTPALMKAFEWRNEVWFHLLGEAASKSEDIIQALPNACAGMAQTIEAQLADESVWRVVARTALADLTNVPGRERAWRLIPKAYVRAIEEATARSWLLHYEQGRVASSQLEPQLATAVRTEITTRGYLIQVLRRAPAALPIYLRDFGFSSEREAQSFLFDLQQSDCVLSESEAQSLGRMFNYNSWTQTAREAKRFLHSRPDFRPMMKECLSLLGIIDRLWVSYQLGVPVHLLPDDAWAAFETEAISLYPRGPSERELWSRSNGLNEDLANEDNGRATWHRCTRELRSGKAPGVHALLNVMLEDFPFNDTLKQLSKQNFWS